jgi:hypothetical protein
VRYTIRWEDLVFWYVDCNTHFVCPSLVNQLACVYVCTYK